MPTFEERKASEQLRIPIKMDTIMDHAKEMGIEVITPSGSKQSSKNLSVK
jgi:hypothetical protein